MQLGLVLHDGLLVAVVLLTLDPLAADYLLQAVELLVEFLDHKLVLFEGVAGLFILSQQPGIRLLQHPMLATFLSQLTPLLVEGLAQFLQLVLPLGTFRLYETLQLCTTGLPSSGLLDLDSQGVIQTLYLL